MRAKEFIVEGVNQVDFNKNLLTILQQKYPGTEFSIQLDRVESADGELTVIANIAEQGSYVGCFMWDVNTGPYTGALGLAIKQTTDQLLQANPGKKPALFIGGDNENPEAWAHIADKLNYKLITDDDELEEGVSEGFPNFNREWDEATRYPEFVNLGKEKWIELVSKGKPVTVTRKNVNKINNTDAADPKSFKLLDPKKQKRALAQLAHGDVEMPIVARYSDGYLELIGGNTRLTAQMAKDGQAKVWLFNVPEELTQGVAEGQDDNGISFQVQKGKNKFATTLSIGNKPVGVYQYDADTGRSIAEVYPEFKGKGLGKLLVLHAIYTAAQLGLDFQEDESRTAEYDNVLDSLSSNGYIVDDDGYWYVTGEGEQYLQQSMKQGVAENFADGKVKGKSRPGRVKRAGASCNGSVTDLRQRAKNASGEKAKMYHWCANMKSGKKK